MEPTSFNPGHEGGWAGTAHAGPGPHPAGIVDVIGRMRAWRANHCQDIPSQ